MANADFYSSGSMDLRYLEIGIALARIDRMNPGKIPFSIPVLTPDMNHDNTQESTVVQQNKANIVTENPGAVEVSNLKTSNYIEIEIPKELCVLPDPTYDIKGEVIIDGRYTLDGGNHDITIVGNIDASGSASISGQGSLSGDGSISGNVSGLSYQHSTGVPYQVSHSGGTFSVDGNGSLSGNGTLSGDGKINMNCTITGTETHHRGAGHINIDGTIDGTIQTILNDVNRYIEKGSKWLVAFIGGDTASPCVVCRLPDSVGYPNNKIFS